MTTDASSGIRKRDSLPILPSKQARQRQWLLQLRGRTSFLMTCHSHCIRNYKEETKLPCWRSALLRRSDHGAFVFLDAAVVLFTFRNGSIIYKHVPTMAPHLQHFHLFQVIYLLGPSSLYHVQARWQEWSSSSEFLPRTVSSTPVCP